MKEETKPLSGVIRDQTGHLSSNELPAGTGAKPMYKNIAWCTGLGINEEGDWNGGNRGNDHAARRCFNLS